MIQVFQCNFVFTAWFLQPTPYTIVLLYRDEIFWDIFSVPCNYTESKVKGVWI